MTLPQLPPQPAPRRLFLWTAGSFLLLMAWEFSGLDLWSAHWFGSASGFPLTDHWLWRRVLHDSVRPLPWLVELGLLVAMVQPFGSFKKLALARRVQVVVTPLVVLLVVSTIKINSSSSCPWDLQEFGGTASYVPHWAWGVRDGGSGRCFPAGHAASAFAFIGSYFAFRHGAPDTARRWFIGVMALGFLLGLAQQVRGAHYMSDTLWTVWLGWTAAALVDLGVSQLILQKASRARMQSP
ncbi:MAG: phosphatase PAP2 family protein [Polaromonas sp.]